MNKAAFLDRDGVINVKAPEGQYVTRWEEVRFLPGVAAAISRLNESGFRVIVISNQRCVAKGLVTSAEVEALHRRISKELADLGAIIDAVYFCPHDTEPACSCRKPAPGMLLRSGKRPQDRSRHLMDDRRFGCRCCRRQERRMQDSLDWPAQKFNRESSPICSPIRCSKPPRGFSSPRVCRKQRVELQNQRASKRNQAWRKAPE